MRFKCQVCAAPIWNRRYPKCEKCGVDLSPELVFSTEQVSKMRQDERIEDERRSEDEAKARLQRYSPKQNQGGWLGDFGDGEAMVAANSEKSR